MELDPQFSLFPVVLSGGSGSRLWPISRSNYPKQFIKLLGAQSMLQKTVLRLSGLQNAQLPLAICNDEHRFILAEQLQEIGAKALRIILEPVPRSTAPAVAVASLFALSKHSNPLLLVLPADHLIEDRESFHQAIKEAIPAALNGKLVLFGIQPNGANLNYGYIQKGLPSNQFAQMFEVESFIEKPQLQEALSLIDSGSCLWNSGIFLMRADTYLQELDKFQPGLLSSARKALDKAKEDLDFLRLDQSAFSELPNLAIDYAVMEQTDRAIVMQPKFEWRDIGSWNSLWEAQEKDEAGNFTSGDVHLSEVENSFVVAQKRLVAVLGLKNIVVSETADAVMVAPKDSEAAVKGLFEKFKKNGRQECDLHQRVYRPWGSYETIDRGEGFQVKKIMVKPGGSLSLQMHKQRAEHWVVVKGVAEVTIGEEVSLLQENQSTYIPLGVTHRLKNPGSEPLYLIEVQSGTYLGEDDIVRFEDIYGRTQQNT